MHFGSNNLCVQQFPCRAVSASAEFLVCSNCQKFRHSYRRLWQAERWGEELGDISTEWGNEGQQSGYIAATGIAASYDSLMSIQAQIHTSIGKEKCYRFMLSRRTASRQRGLHTELMLLLLLLLQSFHSHLIHQLAFTSTHSQQSIIGVSLW